MNTFWKTLGVSVLSVGVLTACGGEENTMSSNDNEEEAEEQTQAEEEQEQQQEEAQSPNIEVAEEAFGARTDSIDNTYATYSAVIKNTGDAPANIGDIQINFEGEEGTIVGTAPMVMAVPDVVMPGEEAYISDYTGIEGVESHEAVADASVNIDFDAADEEPMMLETEGVQVKTDDMFPYIVTGTVINPNEETADDIRLAAALYDDAGELIGVLSGSIQVSLNPDGKAGFELNMPELPSDKEAAEVNVKAYNWSF
ncbi:hypothetical protein SAMN05192534_12818 [Alteribacillus persepolensis]|uniref:Uncharacterized protein n=1 Tax=Alteribacillus persepolensis TaxID=568899 RepID=A0A1G8J238_9BACI|nr:FxLYD domain-containing protein [Alteribacillus persepolensis]SDI25191.1 hypothetical protein SAMN05192534_12818 [Alteribacillus persepolensis]